MYSLWYLYGGNPLIRKNKTTTIEFTDEELSILIDVFSSADSFLNNLRLEAENNTDMNEKDKKGYTDRYEELGDRNWNVLLKIYNVLNKELDEESVIKILENAGDNVKKRY